MPVLLTPRTLPLPRRDLLAWLLALGVPVGSAASEAVSLLRNGRCVLLLRHAANPNWPRRALLIGLGAGSLAKFIHRNLPSTRMTLVEIDARIVPMAQQYFKLPIDPQRMKIVIADGSEFISQARGRYDAIFVDGFSAEGRAGALDTEDFYLSCRDRLSQEGLMICNLLGRSRGFQASALRIRKAFEKRSVVFPSLDSGNAIAFAATGEPVDISLDEMRDQAKLLKAATGLDLAATISRLEQSGSLRGNHLLL